MAATITAECPRCNNLIFVPGYWQEMAPFPCSNCGLLMFLCNKKDKGIDKIENDIGCEDKEKDGS